MLHRSRQKLRKKRLQFNTRLLQSSGLWPPRDLHINPIANWSGKKSARDRAELEREGPQPAALGLPSSVSSAEVESPTSDVYLDDGDAGGPAREKPEGRRPGEAGEVKA